MKLHMMFVAALALTAAACSPPAPTEPTPEPAAPAAPVNAEAAAMVAVLTPVLTEDLGQPVTLSVDTVRTQDDWGWIIVRPERLDWGRTKYAEQAASGMLDGNGTTYALLKRENGAWRVVEFAVGPTDVAYLDWPSRHGAPQELLGLVSN